MKKFIFGCIFFLAGFTWLTVLIILSVQHPHVFNGVDGFVGFLFGNNMMVIFIVAIVLTFIGLRVMLAESGYRLQVPEWMKSEQNKG